MADPKKKKPPKNPYEKRVKARRDRYGKKPPPDDQGDRKKKK